MKKIRTEEKRIKLFQDIQASIDSGTTVEAACRANGVKNISSYYLWKKKFKNNPAEVKAPVAINAPVKATVTFKFNNGEFTVEAPESQCFKAIGFFVGLTGR